MLAPLQQQVTTFWQKQSNPQRITMVALGLALVILVPVLLIWANQPTYSVAYSGLSEQDAAAITEKMSAANIPYQIKTSGTIMVPSDKVYEARLQMAREGYPKESAVGYELFDGNTLGMTEFTQKINYQRALEGELERTIASIESVDNVSVHIVQPEKSLLTSDQSPTTASVTIEENGGMALTASQVKAITNLVANSVEGLAADKVVIVDTEGRMLSGGGLEGGLDGITSISDSQRAIELNAAAEIKHKVETMLADVLGPDKAAVQASVDMDWDQVEITSSTFDPTPAAVRSSQIVTENYSSDGTTIGGVPGAETNLPEPGELVNGGEGSSTYSRSEETINYEISQVNQTEVVAPGQIEKITLSVMVDGITDDAVLASLTSAVAAAAGIDQERGDQLVVAPMTFDRTYLEEQNLAAEQQSQTEMYIQIGIGVAAVLLLILMIWFISRMIKNVRMASGEEWKPILKPVGEMALEGAGLGGYGAYPQMSAGYGGSARVEAPPSLDNIPMPEEDEVVFEPAAKPSTRPEDDQRQQAISTLTEQNPAAVAEIIQIWLSEDERNG